MKLEETPLVSILMTSYNREQYIEDAIVSVINSTYQNWELIIVDDLSTDRSYDIAGSYALKDSRISAYQNESNLGDYPNRNMAASKAKGEYLIYVDSDDMIYPYSVERCVFYMNKYPSAGIGISRPYSPDGMYPIVYSPKNAIKKHYLDNPYLNHAPGSVIIRRHKFIEIGGFTIFRHISDNILWVKMANQFDVVLLPRVLSWPRSHEFQELKYEIKKLGPIVELFKFNISFISRCNHFTEKERLQAVRSINSNYTRKILSDIKHFRFNRAVKLIKHWIKNDFDKKNENQ